STAYATRAVTAATSSSSPPPPLHDPVTATRAASSSSSSSSRDPATAYVTPEFFSSNGDREPHQRPIIDLHQIHEVGEFFSTARGLSVLEVARTTSDDDSASDACTQPRGHV
ncbi:hypothetical protein PIB30_104267, partial [Stylosanthes scabra]|nr:hypothetical protein [Stylosanthes scabra]